MKRILTLDGGGVRGALTTCFLVEAEKQTGKLCRELFDMVAGTSTGALIAACVAAGVPARDILGFYESDAPQVFDLSPTAAWLKRLAEGHAYDSGKIAVVLRKRLGAACDWVLNDAPIRVLLCAMHVSGKPILAVQDTGKNAKATGKLSLVDCATASAAAPTYLTAWYVSPLGGALEGWCVDGGVAGMANPVYEACVQAFDYDDFDPQSTRVISLGTGFSPDRAVNQSDGFIGALSLVTDALLYNAGTRATEAAKRLFPGVVHRFNWELPSAVDMADAGAIRMLVALGQRLAPQMNWKEVLGL